MAFVGPATIGNDILSLGSRKKAQEQQESLSLAPFSMGNPGQFDVPNVNDVRVFQTKQTQEDCCDEEEGVCCMICIGNLTVVSKLVHYFPALIFFSRPRTAAATLRPSVETAMAIKWSSLPREPPHWPLNSMEASLCRSIRVPPWARTLLPVRSRK